MSFNHVTNNPLFLPVEKKIWLSAFLLGIVLAGLGYHIFPLLGITVFDEWFSIYKVGWLLAATTIVVGYGIFLKKIGKHPFLMLYLIAIIWPVTEYVSELLFQQLGINLHTRLLSFILIVLPALGLFVIHHKYLFLKIPFFKIFFIYCVWHLLYFLFNNAHAVDPRMPFQNVWFEGSVGMTQLHTQIISLSVIILVALGLYRHPNPLKLFDQFNYVLLAFASLEALITLLGFPMGVFNQNVDGFLRAQGLYLHPNLFAHHQALLLIYFLTLFAYYRHRIPNTFNLTLLTVGICLNLSAFLLALSKTAIAVFLLCSLLFFVGEQVKLKKPSELILKVGLIALLVLLGSFLFEIVAQQNLWSVLQDRIIKAASFGWRQEVWGYLLSNINGITIWLGHGYTASNVILYQLSYHDAQNTAPLVLVHNGYIQLLHDLGVVGWFIFLAVLSLIGVSIKHLKSDLKGSSALLSVGMIMMSFYFLLVCAFDEMVYFFDSQIIFWLLQTILFQIIYQKQKTWD